MIPFVATILNIGASIEKHKGYKGEWRGLKGQQPLTQDSQM